MKEQKKNAHSRDHKNKVLTSIIKYVWPCLLAFVVYFVLDILDVPSRFGLPIQYINWNAAGLFVGNFVVIVLYIITYMTIDKKNIEKEQNQRDYAKYLLYSTYKRCYELLGFLQENNNEKDLLDTLSSYSTQEKRELIADETNEIFSQDDDIKEITAQGIISKTDFFRIFEPVSQHKRLFV